MSKIVTKVLLTGDKVMVELHYIQPGFPYSAWRNFTKRHDIIQKSKEIGILKDLYRNKSEKACFAHDAAYSDSNDLAKRTVSDQILKERTDKIARNSKHTWWYH